MHKISSCSTIARTGNGSLVLPHDINVAKVVWKAFCESGTRMMEFTSRRDFAVETFED